MYPQQTIVIQQTNPTIQIEDRDVVIVQYQTEKGDPGTPGATFVPSDNVAEILEALRTQISET